MSKISSLYSKIPYKQRMYLRHIYYALANSGFNYRPEEGLDSLRLKILLYFSLHPGQKKKYIREINFIKKQSSADLSYSFVFPYDFIYDYSIDKIKVYKDADKNLFYVIHNDKRLYFKKTIKTELEVQITYYCLLAEQDKQSPHKYLDKDFEIEPDSVMLDVGAAEGSLSLDNIEKLSKLYVFEANGDWVEALQATFEPWKDKVCIINKYVSDNDEGDNVTLDTATGGEHIDFVKIDVEGAEMQIFEGAKKILSQDSLRLAVCTYHRQEDAQKIEQVLMKNKLECKFTDNYMLFTLVNLYPPYFRKGLIRSQKKAESKSV